MYRSDRPIWQVILLFSLLMSASLLAAQTPARAQSDIQLKSLEVDLWPEYDRPQMLVIYRVELDPAVSLPVEMAFRIPVAAELNAVANGQSNESLFNVDSRQEMEGQWTSVRFTATLPVIRLEYYDPALRKEGSQRSFQYTWPGDYAVESLKIQVQRPRSVRDQDMEIAPALDGGTPSGDGLVYYESEKGAIPYGQTFELEVRYQKDNDELSITGQPVQPSAPITSDTPGRVSIASALLWAIGFLGVGLILGGAYWFWQSGRRQQSTGRPTAGRGRRKPAGQAETRPGGEEIVYCHQCGKRADAGDRFCRLCGTRLRLG
jgi:hypothetical protein